jgi:Zn-dependent protease with chaperone function
MAVSSRLFILAAVLAAAAAGQGKQEQIKEPKPGRINFFSKEQDIQLGRESAAEVSKQVTIVRTPPEIQAYVERIGRRLVDQGRIEQYPFTFTVVNEPSINAFALPGGPMFVHTGLITAAENEAQIAGVLGHEMAHVLLRHGTNQVSKANLIQLPAMIASIAAGQKGQMVGMLTQLGIQVGAGSLLLKYSRNAETDADNLGARIMQRAGYNPIEMARFFEKLEAESGGGGGRAAQFFSDHPNPGNRVKFVETLVQQLPATRYPPESNDLARTKKLVAQLPAPPKRGQAQQQAPQVPRLNTGRLVNYNGNGFVLAVPETWRAVSEGQGTSVTLAPPEGIVQTSGGSAVGLGVIVSQVPVPQGQRLDLATATRSMLQNVIQGNPGMRQDGSSQATRVDGRQALLSRLLSQSPYASTNEVDYVLTVDYGNAVGSFIFVIPEPYDSQMHNTLSQMIQSIRFGM